MAASTDTPTSRGFRMPAEWHPQEAVWLSWPHNRETWPGAFDPVPHVFAEIAAEISESQLVRINVNSEAMSESVRTLLNESGVNVANVSFHINPTNDCWMRDHGPIYVLRHAAGKQQRAITNWRYNSWGGKYSPYDSDNAIPERISAEFHEHRFDGGLVLEGGSIDVNGVGTLLTTRSCLLHKNRNPQSSQAEIEQRLRDFLGVTKILWLGDGIVGDDTDGHIDDITRFVSPRVIVTAVEEDAGDDNAIPLNQNLELLQQMTDQDGNPFEIIQLPMPRPVFFQNHRLPASYANFLICNEKVLVPIYGCDRDESALAVLQELFPDRSVVGIDCRPLVWGLGAIHCVTQQQPLADAILQPIN